MNPNNSEFYINSLSYSQLRTFISNTWEWQNNRLLWIYDNTVWVSSAVWTILHKFVETYLKTWNIETAINHSHKCISAWSDGITYLIDPNEIDLKVSNLDDIKKHFKTKVILAISVLTLLSLSAFGFFSYIDTKKNSITQIESSLSMASRSLTDYIDLYISSKRHIIEMTARSL